MEFYLNIRCKNEKVVKNSPIFELPKIQNNTAFTSSKWRRIILLFSQKMK